MRRAKLEPRAEPRVKLDVEDDRTAYLFQLGRDNFVTAKKVKYYYRQDIFKYKETFYSPNYQIHQYDIKNLKNKESRIAKCDKCDTRSLSMAKE